MVVRSEECTLYFPHLFSAFYSCIGVAATRGTTCKNAGVMRNGSASFISSGRLRKRPVERAAGVRFNQGTQYLGSEILPPARKNSCGHCNRRHVTPFGSSLCAAHLLLLYTTKSVAAAAPFPPPCAPWRRFMSFTRLFQIHMLYHIDRLHALTDLSLSAAMARLRFSDSAGQR